MHLRTTGSILRRIVRYNLSFALLTAAIVLLGEEIFHFYYHGGLLGGLVIARFALYIFMLGLVMSFVAWRRVNLSLMALFCLIQVMQSVHVDYFGAPITPDMIGQFFSNIRENPLEIISSVRAGNLPAGLLIILCFIVGWQLQKRLYAHVFAWRPGIVFLACLAIFPYQIATALKPHKYYPQPAETMVSNFINALSLYTLRDEFSKARPDYAPYIISPVKSSVRNIVLIIGESANPDYMSLYGYGKDTTPLLAKQRDRNMVKEIFSTSVSTFPSISLLMNIVREPGNIAPIEKHEHNLMYMAREAGFRTAWIGNQAANNLIYAGLEKTDFSLTSQAGAFFSGFSKDDDVLLQTLQAQPLSSRNFIVIHQRNLHSPYESNYENHKELALFSDEEISKAADTRTQSRMRYENAMRYNDYTLYHLIEYVKETLKDKGESYIFYTSDHSELFGEDGLFAHSHLNMNVARVPLIAQGINASPALMKRISGVNTHYELGRLIAAMLGYKIDNPNASEGVYFLHSPDLYNPSRHIEYRLDAKGRLGYNKTIDTPDLNH